MPQQALIGEVAGLFAGRPVDHWRDLLQAVDCCFEVLLTAEQLAGQQQFAARAAIDDAGPTYPAWIDGRAVVTPKDFETVEDAGNLAWRKNPD